MATNQLRRVLQTLSRADRYPEVAGRTDGQLLESYVRSREEAAFAALVRRHGPMVWGVCRRLLHNHHDAEDAFQATFLVLVRKAASVVPTDKVANWLYGVARQTAMYARATAAKREAREKQVTAMPEAAAVQQDLWHSLEPLLDQELGRLPDKYRAVLVLCDLEGKTRKEAAGHFRLPEGTVASRLATARTLLAKRLARHGLATSLASLAVALTASASAACVPSSVVTSTVKVVKLLAAGQAASGIISATVAALTNEVLKAMLIQKIKVLTAILLSVVFVAGGLFTYRTALGSTESARAGKETDVPRVVQADVPAGTAPKEPGQAEEPRPLTIDQVTGKMLRKVGNRFDVEVVGRKDGVVSGTDLYFYDSLIETAAVHAGLVKVGEKAIITVTVEKCPESGVGSTRNGVKSMRWDAARAGDTAFRLERRAEKKGGKPGDKDRPSEKDK
jgi:RNA polymerase sigma factor (sigma-70 family)